MTPEVAGTGPRGKPQRFSPIQGILNSGCQTVRRRMERAMNGLINRAIECFVRDSYGDALWHEVTGGLGIDEAAFEPLIELQGRDLTSADLALCSEGQLGGG